MALLEYEIVSSSTYNPPLIVVNGFLTVFFEGKEIYRRYLSGEVRITEIRIVSYGYGFGLLFSTEEFEVLK